MVDHATLTDPELHEPKGASTATSGKVYTADGSGSGAWTKPFKYANVATDYSVGSPYVYSATTSETVLNPTVNNLSLSQFTVQTSPNFRLRYDGVETLFGKIFLNVSYTHAAGGDRDLEFVAYKSGVVLGRSRVIRTTPNNYYNTITLVSDTTLTTNDYIEFFGRGSASHTVNIVKLYASVEGHVA